jgi:DNA-binding transcriptional ArsR family regulator
MSTDAATVLAWLKAVGETSRLRLLALCARQDLSVSDLADVLRQSEPRVSRHLRILCDAGLLERLRQGQWVHYRLTQNTAAVSFVQGLLAQVDRNDPVFARDQERAFGRPMSAPNTGVSLAVALTERGRAGSRSDGGNTPTADMRVGGRRTSSKGLPTQAQSGSGPDGGGSARVRPAESRLGKALREVMESTPGDGTGSDARKSALVVGVEHLELLEAAALEADECVAIAHSRRAVQTARAFAERRGFACRVLLAASPDALCARDVQAATERSAPAGDSFAGRSVTRESLEGAGGAFDMVVLDHLAVPDSALESLLDHGRRALGHGGRLWLFGKYESLEVSREKVVEHPIGRLRRMLSDVGLSCERLNPIEADGQHVLAAVAVPSRGLSRGRGAA